MFKVSPYLSIFDMSVTCILAVTSLRTGHLCLGQEWQGSAAFAPYDLPLLPRASATVAPCSSSSTFTGMQDDSDDDVPLSVIRANNSSVDSGCKVCSVKYGDPADPKKTEEWVRCNSCGTWLHDSCAEEYGAFGDSMSDYYYYYNLYSYSKYKSIQQYKHGMQTITIRANYVFKRLLTDCGLLQQRSRPIVPYV